MSKLTPNETDVINHARNHAQHWRTMPDSYWLARLVQEVGELASALVDEHPDTPDHELKQIASICLNWLEKRNP